MKKTFSLYCYRFLLALLCTQHLLLHQLLICVLLKPLIYIQHDGLRLLQEPPTAKIGFARAASLVKEFREEATNSVLVDNGDLIQGSPMGDYTWRIKALKKGKFTLYLKV